MKLIELKKYSWLALIIVPLIFVFGVYLNNITDEKTTETEILGGQINSACPEENIDWSIAIEALTKHFSNLKKQNPSKEIDLGSTDIERHFAENCKEDLKIYEEYLASYDWVENFFNKRIKELVGVEKYEDIIKNYIQPKNFSGCDNYLLESGNNRANEIYSMREMAKEKKYKEVLSLSEKYLNDSEVWYCGSIFWTQRAEAFYNLGNCSQALIESAHAFAVADSINSEDEPEKKFYFTVLNSNICK